MFCEIAFHKVTVNHNQNPIRQMFIKFNLGAVGAIFILQKLETELQISNTALILLL